MPDIQGNNVGAMVTPFTTDDDYATHAAKYGQGGLRTAADEAERDAITLKRREWWMLVRYLSDGSTWELVPGLSSNDLADNDNWRQYAGGFDYTPTVVPDESVLVPGRVYINEPSGAALLLPTAADYIGQRVGIIGYSRIDCAAGDKISGIGSQLRDTFQLGNNRYVELVAATDGVWQVVSLPDTDNNVAGDDPGRATVRNLAYDADNVATALGGFGYAVGDRFSDVGYDYTLSITASNELRWTRNSRGGQSGQVRDIYAVPATKRQEVIDEDSPAVLETDSAYYDKEFYDEVTEAPDIRHYRCAPSVQADGSTAWKWFRTVIL